MTRTNADLGRLALRLGLGGCILFPRVAKLMGGIDGITQLVTAAGLPAFVAYGVYVGEVVAPILVVIGWYSRIGASIAGVLGWAARTRPPLASNSRWRAWRFCQRPVGRGAGVGVGACGAASPGNRSSSNRARDILAIVVHAVARALFAARFSRRPSY